MDRSVLQVARFYKPALVYKARHRNESFLFPVAGDIIPRTARSRSSRVEPRQRREDGLWCCAPAVRYLARRNEP
jgi:hypothetical protein